MIGDIKININGVNQVKILKNIQKNNIHARHIKKLAYNKMELIITSNDYQKVKKLLQNTNNSIQVISGYISPLKFLLHKIGIVLGIFICCVGLIVQNTFVWDIQIVGADSIQPVEILKQLNNYGIKVGYSKNKINSKQIEQSLCNDFNKICLASVSVKGTTLIVNIKEELTVNEIDKKGEQSNIIASFDMTITSINVFQGYTKFKVGDSVKKGDVLVYGFEYDQNNVKTDCYAKAEISGEVIYQHTLVYDPNGFSLCRTGKTITRTNLEICGIRTKNKLTNNFEFYEIENTTKLLCHNLLFPIKKHTCTIYELEKKPNNSDFEAVKQELQEQAIQIVEKKCENSLQKQKSFCIINKVNELYYITAFVVANAVI